MADSRRISSKRKRSRSRAIMRLFLRFLVCSLQAVLMLGGASAYGQGCPPMYSEYFDGVTPPVLPSGWNASQGMNITGAPLWVTSPITPHTPPNDVFSTAPDNILDNRLDTPVTYVRVYEQTVTFRQSYNLENGFDGAVLEVSAPNINGGAFTDITDPAVGGTLSPGYNSVISSAFQSPIGGRMAWSGNSGGYIYTWAHIGTIIPEYTHVALRFRLVTDNSRASGGWRIDNFDWHHNECATPTATATATATATPEASPTPTPAPTPTPNPTPSPTPPPSGNGKIAFASTRYGLLNIYVMNSEGYNQTRLTFNNGGGNSAPAWSPDGTRIAFTSTRDGNKEIYVMEADGSNQTNLTNNPAGQEDAAAWSPDGARIAYTSLEGLVGEIFVMNADGSNPINLTNNPASDGSAVWSPDGTKIAFTSVRNGHAGVYVMNADGSNQTRLTSDLTDNFGPAWSPDGARIAFTSHRDVHYALYVINADGSNEMGLLGSAFFDYYAPAWSPDGTKIALYSYFSHEYLICVLAVDRSSLEFLTYDGFAIDPDWQRVPSPVPSPTPAQALNLSTRLRVDTADRVPIGGFIVTGTAPKSVAVRGIGPSYTWTEGLADPVLELRDSAGGLVIQNDDWQDDPAQAAQLTALGLALGHPKESGFIVTLQPSTYTAILSGKNQTTGLGLVEIYDVNATANSQLANISTRGMVLANPDVMIGGFILAGETTTHVAVRGIGPSLAQFGLGPVLADPGLRLVDENGYTMDANDDWGDNPQLSLLGLGLQNPKEAGFVTSLIPGAYTVILSGQDNSVGLGVVEIYNVH